MLELLLHIKDNNSLASINMPACEIQPVNEMILILPDIVKDIYNSFSMRYDTILILHFDNQYNFETDFDKCSVHVYLCSFDGQIL